MDVTQKIDNLEKTINEMNENIKSMKFQMELYFSYIVDLRKATPAVGRLRQMQINRLSVLELVRDIIKDTHLKFWLEFGTLLGAVRHNNFIPWDQDIDISILHEDLSAFIDTLNNYFKSTGGHLKAISQEQYVKETGTDSTEIDDTKDTVYRIVGTDDLFPYVDIYVWKVSQKYEDTLWVHEEGKYYYIDTNNLFPLKQTSFEKLEYNIPNKSNDALMRHYGNIYAFPRVPCRDYIPQVMYEPPRIKLQPKK